LDAGSYEKSDPDRSRPSLRVFDASYPYSKASTSVFNFRASLSDFPFILFIETVSVFF